MMEKVSIYEVYRLHAGSFFTIGSEDKGFMVSRYAYPYEGGYLFIVSNKSNVVDRLFTVTYCTGSGQVSQCLAPRSDMFTDLHSTEKAAKDRIKDMICNGETVRTLASFLS